MPDTWMARQLIVEPTGCGLFVRMLAPARDPLKYAADPQDVGLRYQ